MAGKEAFWKRCTQVDRRNVDSICMGRSSNGEFSDVLMRGVPLISLKPAASLVRDEKIAASIFRIESQALDVTFESMFTHFGDQDPGVQSVRFGIEFPDARFLLGNVKISRFIIRDRSFAFSDGESADLLGDDTSFSISAQFMLFHGACFRRTDEVHFAGFTAVVEATTIVRTRQTVVVDSIECSRFSVDAENDKFKSVGSLINYDKIHRHTIDQDVLTNVDIAWLRYAQALQNQSIQVTNRHPVRRFIAGNNCTLRGGDRMDPYAHVVLILCIRSGELHGGADRNDFVSKGAVVCYESAEAQQNRYDSSENCRWHESVIRYPVSQCLSPSEK